MVQILNTYHIYLYSVIALLIGGSVSFRLLVFSDNWIKPSWLDIPLLVISFLLIAYGAYLLLDTLEPISQTGSLSQPQRQLLTREL